MSERSERIMSTADGVVVESSDRVLHIRLDRPDRKNALHVPAITRIVRALEDAAVDDSLRAIVIGSTGVDFCAGADWVATNTSDCTRPRLGSIQRRTPLQAHRVIELLSDPITRLAPAPIRWTG